VPLGSTQALRPAIPPAGGIGEKGVMAAQGVLEAGSFLKAGILYETVVSDESLPK
jgi:hypothetical protein